MRSTVLGRSLSLGACTVLVLGGAAGVAAGPAAATPAKATPVKATTAATCDPDSENSRGDFDGDSSSDVAVGMPWYQDGAGGVDLRGTHTPSVVLTSGALGVGTGEGDEFGAAIAMADLDQDGCADLVIAAPAEGQSAGSDGAGGNEGQVHIVFGSPDGISTSTVITLPHDSANLDHFGNTLALVPRDVGGVRVHDLYVGAPDATVSEQASAGEVFRYTLTPVTTGRRITATLREVRSQDSAGVPGSAETGDGFGATMASTDSGGVLVGAPNEDVGSVRNAGSVWFLRVNAAGTPIASQSWSQNSAGVPGSAEKADHFGAAVGSRGGAAVVGVPDENVGSLAEAGMVQVFTRNSSGALVPGKSITQDTPGIPGAVEAGDRFGAAVAVEDSGLCQEALDVAVGAPGEDIGTRADAGAITLISLTPGSGCAAKSIRQGSGLAGAAEDGDEVGSVLGLTRGRTDLDEDYSDRLLIGVPDEDIGAVPNAGMVQPAHYGITSDGVTSTTLKFSKGYLLSNYYGQVLSTPSD